MKFRSLDLSGFGAVEGRTLDLGREERGLHVVLGSNEAGKSTCLRAIRGLLFGIADGRDLAGRASKDLRIVGAVETDEGDTIHVLRRKGRKNTLLFLDDEGESQEPVDPQLWSRVIGGLDQGVYDSFFGLDDESLRAGAEQLLSEGGGVGATLFGASVGTRRLQELGDQLRDESDELFKPRGSTQRVSKLTQRIKDLEDQKKEATLTVADLEARQEAFTSADRRVEELTARQGELIREKGRLESVVELRRLTSKSEVLRSRRRDLPELPEDFRFRAGRTQEDLERSKKARDQALESLASIDVDLEKLVAGVRDRALVEHRDRIRVMASRLPALREGLAGLGVPDFAGFLVVERGVDFSVIDGFDSLAAERVVELASSFESLEQERRSAEVSLEQFSKERERLHADRPAAVTGESIDALQAELDEARRSIDLDGEIERLEESVRVELASLQDESARELGTELEIEALARLRWPEASSVRASCARWAEARSELDRHRGLLQTAEERCRDLGRRVEREQTRSALPDPIALDRTRERRDATWRQVRGRFLSESDFVDLEPSTSDAELASRFEGHASESDQLSDQLRNEAEAIQARRDAEERLREAEDAHEDAKRSEAACVQRVEQSETELGLLVADCPGEPPSFDGFEDVIDRRRELSERAVRLRSAQAECESKIGRRASALDSLSRAWSVFDPAPKPSGSKLSRLCAQVESVVSEARQSVQAYIEWQTLEKKNGEQLEDATSRLERARAALESWREDFDQAAAEVGFEAGAKAQDTLEEVKRRRELKRQSRDRDLCLGFQKDALELLGELGFEAEADRPEAWLEQAVEELVHAEELDASRRELSSERDRRRDALERAEADFTTASAAREACLRPLAGTEFVEESGRLPEESELAAFLEVLVVQEQLRQDLRSLEDQIAEVESRGSLESEVAAAEAETRLAILPGQIEAGLKELQVASSERGEAQRRLDELARERGASDIELELEQVRAELDEVAHRVRVLETAQALLRHRIDDYRREHQGPILERASAAFERLTGGAFRGLEVDWDDQSRFVAVLAGERSAERRFVEELSSGTRDQLYLALKVATIESLIESSQAPRMPCVFDDVLVHFDDKRASHALEVLAELGKHTQVLLFTHHEHVFRRAEGVAVGRHEL
ncbi:MAG: AAA family ATPase [Planctomycetota bacterium]